MCLRTNSGESKRARLPDRRASEAFTFEHHGANYTATISRFNDDRIAEIFIDASKPGSALAEHASDAAVLVSLLLQHGVTPAKIIHSIAGPLKTALIKAEDGE